MAGKIYCNTFGEDGRVVFSTKENYHYQIMQALRERGYARVAGSALEDGTWLDGDGGYVVHADLAKGGKSVLFMARDAETADKVIEALNLSFPGIALHGKIWVSAPE